MAAALATTLALGLLAAEAAAGNEAAAGTEATAGAEAAAGTEAAAGARVAVLDAAGRVVVSEALGPGGRWCLVWNHSVTGIAVSDCFRTETAPGAAPCAGLRFVLERSHQPDFAAGLGEVPGRGRTVPDGRGGYWIVGIEAAVPAAGLPLRAGGPAVAHRLRIGGAETPIPAERGARLLIRAVGED